MTRTWDSQFTWLYLRFRKRLTNPPTRHAALHARRDRHGPHRLPRALDVPACRSTEVQPAEGSEAGRSGMNTPPSLAEFISTAQTPSPAVRCSPAWAACRPSISTGRILRKPRNTAIICPISSKSSPPVPSRARLAPRRFSSHPLPRPVLPH